ncbi:hydrogenase maturation protein [Poseidonibacter lekithochrous]|uniref:hydrogenase maturation protein n=1 Tax=Poseidonibacter lekithochrous TaxID=1904463 RepID=UPI000D349E23|nr:hydrogenase maturation protein [Poseidonibacter lekithochrous]
MKILLIISSFNSLSQSVYCKLRELNHEISVKFAISKELMIEEVQSLNPDIVLSPFLKEYLPCEIFENYDSFILHPGIIGDRGHNSLDHAINDEVKQWGVVILKADHELDAGDIYAQANFPMRISSKASIYRNEVNKASLEALEEFLENYQNKNFIPTKQIQNDIHTPITMDKRIIDWNNDTTKEIIKKINMSDSYPGVKENLLGIDCYLYGASYEETFRGELKEILAKRDGAICIGTIDGALWISHIKEVGKFKLPATYVLKNKIKGIAENRLPLIVDYKMKTYHEISMIQKGEVTYLYFNFYNGAMSSAQALRLKYAVDFLKDECKVLVLMGGDDFFSNGIHLNILEDSKKQGEDGWSNINAMNDVVKSVLLSEDIITIASFSKNAGAGGVFLGLSCDYVIGCDGVVLNPHYKTMGLTGSEYHTYSLPKRVGYEKAQELLDECLPISVSEAKKINMIDEVFQSSSYMKDLENFSNALLEDEDKYEDFIDSKKDKLYDDEELMESCKEKELSIMYDEFWLSSSSFHTLRKNFVNKTKPTNTPKRLKGKTDA